MAHPWQDLRIAARGLRRHPAFAIAAITTLALGIGANTAVFSIVHGVLLRPLPYPGADQIALLSSANQVGVPDADDWRARSHTVTSISVLLRQWNVDLVGSGDPQRLNGSVVEPNLFPMLGLTPLRGRLFGTDDNRPGAPRVGVISDHFWQRQFNRDPNVVGRSVILNDRPTTIVGIMPATADVFGDNIDVWLPVASETPWALDQRGTNMFDVVGRVSPGTSWSDVTREMALISADLARTYPRTNTGKVAVPQPLLTALVGNVRTPILVLESAVGIVLVLVTANLVGLLIARANAREPEVALRVALGAQRRELATLLATEGAIIAAIGGAMGIGIAIVGRHLLLSVLPTALPRVEGIRVDWRVMALAVGLVVASGMVLMAVPMLHTLRATRGGGAPSAVRTRDSRPIQRVLGSLVAAEVGMAVVVLTLSALLGRTFIALQHVSLGFDPTQVVSGELVLPELRYSKVDDQTRVFRAVAQRLAATPGIEAAGSVVGLPLGPGGGIGQGIIVEGQAPVTPGTEPSVRVRPVAGDYFGTLRIPLRGGRMFTDADDERSIPVALVNETLARTLWPTGSPIGHRLRRPGAAGTPIIWMTIVGIVGDTKTNGLTTGDQPAVYLPYVQHTESWMRWGTLVVRGQGQPAQLAQAMRAAIAAVDPLIPIGNVAQLTEYRSAAMAQQRLDAVVLAVFALGALVIAIQGVYGTLAYVVEQRRREIGIRVAVGATPHAVQRTIVGRGMRSVMIGMAAGLVVAVAAGRAASSLLYGVSADDPLNYLAVACIIGAAALCGAIGPAWRASRADPLEALRAS
jgi:putative ABC transport system permease protein